MDTGAIGEITRGFSSIHGCSLPGSTGYGYYPYGAYSYYDDGYYDDAYVPGEYSQSEYDNGNGDSSVSQVQAALARKDTTVEPSTAGWAQRLKTL